MRHNTAFQFIPELIGDFGHVMKLSKNPKQLYIESAINTLHSAASVFSASREHNNTKQKRETAQKLRQMYDEMERARTDNYVAEALHKLDITYEAIRSRISDGQFGDKEVRDFIRCLKENLNRMISILNCIPIEEQSSDSGKIEEVTRRTLRDYNKLIKEFIEEDEEYDEN